MRKSNFLSSKNKLIMLLSLFMVMLFSIAMTIGFGIAPVKAAATETHEVIGASVRLPDDNVGTSIRFTYVINTNSVNLGEVKEMGVVVKVRDEIDPTFDYSGNSGEVVKFIEDGKTVNDYNICSFDEDKYVLDEQGSFAVMHVYCYNIPENNIHSDLACIGYYSLDGVNYQETSPIAEKSIAYVIKAALDSGEYVDVESTLTAVLESATDHRGGSATISEQATCEVCGVKYGDTKAIEYSIADGFSTEDVTAIFGSQVTLDSATCDNAGISVAVNSNKLELSGSLVYDTPISFTLTAGDQSKTVQLKLYTKVIDEASDLECLITDSATKIDGYYILANNIDASSYTHNQYYSVDANTKTTGGFAGTFDGRGYNIDGMTMNGMGLFGDIHGATVKNVAITNIKFGDSTVTTGLAGYIQRASGKTVTFSNIYLHAEKLSETSTYSALFAANHQGGVSDTYPEIIENCIFVLEEDNLTAFRGSFAANNTGRDTQNRYNDFYIVSPTIMAHIRSSNDASNKAAESKAKYDENGITYTAFNSYTNVTRYNDFEEMTKAGNSYATFSSDYWDTTGDYPVWKNLLANQA